MAKITFRLFLESLNKLAEEHPNSLDLPIVYGKYEPDNSEATDENKEYVYSRWFPNIGYYNGNDFYAESQPFNAVCIN